MSTKGIINFRHIGIVTTNLQESKDFYLKILGLEIINDALESGAYIDNMLGAKNIKVNTVKMGIPNSKQVMVELLHFHSPETAPNTTQTTLFTKGMTHFAVEVDSADEIHKSLVESKYEVISAPQVTENNYAKVLFVKEPNGYFIELVEIL